MRPSIVPFAVANRMADGWVDHNTWKRGAKHRLTDADTLDLCWCDTDRQGAGEPKKGRLLGFAACSF
nr:hypothetical protein [uncultured Brevundimonas sp.]